ncbi:hypothetical protein KY289_035124 [Solanum tuberosum]|nr:hypothetical protein KY289_035124 [Solanum tuberosum]
MKYTPGGFLIPISNPSMKFSCRSNLLSGCHYYSHYQAKFVGPKNEGKVEATKMFVQQNWAVYWDEIFLMLRIGYGYGRIKPIACLIGEGEVGIIYDCHRSNQTSHFEDTLELLREIVHALSSVVKGALKP